MKKKTIKEIMRIVKEEWPHYKRAVREVDNKLVNSLYNKAKQLKW